MNPTGSRFCNGVTLTTQKSTIHTLKGRVHAWIWFNSSYSGKS
jgi:hypothetical protein